MKDGAVSESWQASYMIYTTCMSFRLSNPVDMKKLPFHLSLPNLLVCSRCHGQAGIALGPVLFIIAILAVIAAAIAAGSGGFAPSITTDKAKVLAQTIIQQTTTMRDSVDMLMANGCQDTQLSFLSPRLSAANYTNSNAPADGSCSVFSSNSTNAILPVIPADALDSTINPGGYFGGQNIIINGTNKIYSGWQCTATANIPELIVMIAPLKREVCQQLNIADYGDSSITCDQGSCNGSMGMGPFNGSYIINGGLDVSQCPKRLLSSCLYTNSMYLYYRVLLIRG